MIFANAFGSKLISAIWIAIAISLCATIATAAYADEVTLGEEHTVDYPAHQAYLLTQDALRGDGVLFEATPTEGLVTLWNNINENVGLFSSLMGNLPRYRYEIQVVSLGSSRCKVIVDVRGENLTEAQLQAYTASKKLDLFNQIDQLARAYPPAAQTPAAGGVNFALLPHENLQGLAQRVTGSADNWRIIAQDNGVRSPTEVAPFQSIWVRNNLLKQGHTGAAAGQ